MADAEALGKERDSYFYGNQMQPGQLEHRELEGGVVTEAGRVAGSYRTVRVISRILNSIPLE